MFKIIATLFVGLLLSSPAFAQEFGVTGGFHYTSAEARTAGVSENSEIGYKAGIVARMAMLNQLNFRSGLIYSHRPFELEAGGTTYSHEFNYIDIPALVELKMNEMVGIFAGLTIGINVGDDVSPSQGVSTSGTTDIIPLLHGGVSLLFEDMYGFDIFVERGTGNVYDGAENFMSIGANFVWWL